MSSSAKPKRALIAYCVLADRLKTPGLGLVQAMTPFLAEACQQFAGELFDATKFSASVAQRYGIHIPRLAALGLTEQLAAEGVLSPVSGHAISTVYRYTQAPAVLEEATSPLTESEVEAVLRSFVDFCRTDDRLQTVDDGALESAFLDRLLHVDSMRLLTRREVSIAAKKTPDTLVLKKKAEPSEQPDRAELHLDFMVSQFLLDLRDDNPAAFERVSNIAFANMAAEAIACFRDPPAATTPLTGLVVYLDSPLLLDMLGVNAEYAEYGQELLEAIHASGAKPAVFDHCVAEAESAIQARLAYLRSGVNKVASNWGTTAAPTLLAALVGNVGERAKQRLQIEVKRDPEVNLHRRAQSTVGDIESRMTSRMQAWRNEDAKEYDRKSVWAMLAIRETTDPRPRLCDAKQLLLTRNTALVGIANEAWGTWLKGATSHSSSNIERWAPVAVSDKQFAGYLWMRSGGGNGAMSKARLLAHCSAAVRPRADLKARAYNLVLELSGRQEADDVAALLEDREGARALMRATAGDPEDVTSERIPFLLEKVKLAAGEYAAEIERQAADARLAEQKAAHDEQVRRLQDETAETQRAHAEHVTASQLALAQHQADQQALLAQNAALAKNLAEIAENEQRRRTQILNEGLRAGTAIYGRLRWGTAGVFGVASGGVALLSSAEPQIAASLTVVLGSAGFWFVPDILDRPLAAIAMRRLIATVKARDPDVAIPLERPDFKRGTWSSLAIPSLGQRDEA